MAMSDDMTGGWEDLRGWREGGLARKGGTSFNWSTVGKGNVESGKTLTAQQGLRRPSSRHYRC